MPIPLRAALLIFSVFVTQIFSQYYLHIWSFSGKIVDQDSLPVENALVSFTSNQGGKSTLTAFDGTFWMKYDSLVYLHTDAKAANPKVNNLSLQNNVLSFKTDISEPIRADLYDLKGSLIKSLMNEKKAAGMQRIDLGQTWPSAMMVLRLRIGASVSTFKVLKSGCILNANFGSAVASAAPVALEKSLAVGDSLIISRNGYATRRITLASRFDTTMLVYLNANRIWQKQMTGLSAQYIQPSDEIAVMWTPLSATDSCAYYELYRTIKTKPDNQPDKSSMTLAAGLKPIDSDSAHYIERPGLDNGRYYFLIRPVRIVANGAGFDSIKGAPSAIASCVVGDEVSFSINHGALFTANDECSLTVTDIQNRLVSIRFTQNTNSYLIKASGEKLQVNFDDPLNPPPDSLVRRLISQGWLQSTGTLLSTTTKISIPDFDAVDPLNAIRSYAMNSRRSFPWALKQGNGSKTVFAEFTFATGTKDTLLDYIDIAPYSIDLTYRNIPNTANATMRTKPLDSFGDIGYYFYKNIVQFSISINGDTTVNRDIDYWLALADTNSIFTYRITDRLFAWLETSPEHGVLTGIGAEHDPGTIYSYSIDPMTPDGAGHLDTLRQTFRSPQGGPQDMDLAFKLKGSQYMNETCIPGSFWGPHPAYWDGLYRPPSFFPGQNIKTFSNPTIAFNNIKKMTIYAYALSGCKEFTILSRFTGKHFNDVRVVASTGELYSVSKGIDSRTGPHSYFDWYQPRATLNPSAPGFISNGSIIQSIFSYPLNSSPSITDNGYANVKSITMVIAQWPNGQSWNIALSSDPLNRNVTSDTITPSALYNQRHIELPYKISATASSVNDVDWNNIDPTGWAPGRYLMGIIAEDEFGNSGFAPVGDVSAYKPYTNPWCITVIAGH